MAAASSATPLIGLDAVAIDCETTGLDPRRARVVELAAVRLAAGRLVDTPVFRTLVRPPLPIPQATTAIHGIDDAAVAGAPPFAQAWRNFSAFIGEAVVVGHAIGFDLAVLQAECERAGLPWRQPRSLCTRLLAECVAPELPEHTLEELAAWLGLARTEARHTALGDARLAARIFLALVPHLRARGIRTLAEAEQAIRARVEAIAQEQRAGWIEPIAAPAAALSSGPRLDTYPFRHRVADVMQTPPRSIGADAPAAVALQRMARERISSLLVAPSEDPASLDPQSAAIVTERDLLRALAAHGAAALDQPVGAFASRPLHTIPADAFVYRAMSRMHRLKVRHLPVTDAQGRLCGMVSARDLLRLRAQEAVGLGDAVMEAPDVGALARAWADLPRVAAALCADGIAAGQAAAIISDEVGALTQRAAMLAEERLRDEGRGGPPCPFAVAVLGSAGRGESLLALDQDNAVIFAEGEPDGAADRWFAAFGELLADTLHAVGVPYCKGGVMARNPAWRGSIATWRERIAHWMTRSHPADLLSVDIFFDLRAVHGELGLAETVWREAFDQAQGRIEFAKLLAEAAGRSEPAFTLFGRIRTENGRIDLKKAGLFGIVSTARALAIRHHILARSTAARLDGIAALGLGGAEDLARLREAQEVFLELILRQQIDDLGTGRRPDNSVVPRALSPGDHERLRTALRAVRHLDTLTRDLLFHG